jgi:hypothetical protein
VSEGLLAAVPEKLIHETCVVVFHSVEKPVAFPDGPPYGNLSPDAVENTFAVDAKPAIPVCDGRERSGALKPDLEAQILQSQKHPIDGALRRADREHSCQPTPHVKMLGSS